MKKSNTKKKSNSKKIIMGSLVGVVTVIAVLITASILEENGFRFNSRGNEVLPYIGNADMYEILTDQSGTGHFVYVGMPTCPACQRFEPILRETLQELDQELSYFQTTRAREADDESEMTTSEILDIIGIDSVPSMVYIVNGQVVDSFTGVREREGILAFFEANGGLN